MSTLKPPMFITFEGLDGSGKGTQLLRLEALIKDHKNNFLGDKYSPIWSTREPTKLTKPGLEIANGMAQHKDISGEDAAKLFVEDRIIHTQNYILPRLFEGSFVLSDRYDLSTLSYQLTQGIAFDELYKMHRYEEGKTFVPHLTLVFDLPVEEAQRRINLRDEKKEQFENLEFQTLLYEKQEEVLYSLSFYQPGREIIRINANQNVDDVTKEMVDKINDSFAVSTSSHSFYKMKRS
jgi:dTMP kinase